jgi:ACS family hexuronate transporter-like MFS transporter
VREHLVARHAGHVLVPEHAHVRSAERVREIDEAARLVELRGVFRRVHVVHLRRRAEAGNGEPVRRKLPLRVADTLGRKLRHLGEIHVRQDPAQLDRGELVLGREVENPGPGPCRAAKGGESQWQLFGRLPGQQQCSRGSDELSASSHGVASETTFRVTVTATRPSYRWTICALLFAVTTINYMDRQVLSILAPTLQRELSWSESQYAAVVYSFTLVYAFGFLIAGRWLDRVGVRRGFATAVVVWSLAAIGHALARTTAAFSAARALLGLGESANFPGAIKSVGEWFPKDERALATGIFNAGTNTGAILTPLIVPWIALNWGWRWAFVVTGSLGFLWLLLWLALYRSPEATSAAPAAPAVPWLHLLRVRQTWAIVTGKFLADPVWWFYLYWLPKFLDARYGIKLAQVALPLITVYVIADVGSIGGGWLSSGLLKRGWTVNRARKTAMLLMALAIVPTALAPRVGSLWGAVLIVSVAAAAHQGWSANVYTLASDMFPPSAVASVSGIGGFAGAMGGVLFQWLTGRILDATGGNYASIFAVCGFAYVTAWTIIHILSPRLEPLKELS